MARRWLLRRSIRFSRFVRDILTTRITHILVTTRITGHLDLGLAGTGRAIRSGDASDMDLGTGTDSVEELGYFGDDFGRLQLGMDGCGGGRVGERDVAG